MSRQEHHHEADDNSVISSTSVTSVQSIQTSHSSSMYVPNTSEVEEPTASEDGNLNVYVQIKACRELALGEKTADPYVRVKLGDHDIHETLPLMQTNKPKFREAQHHSFILNCSSPQLSDARGLTFVVCDHALKDRDDVEDGMKEIGKVRIPPQAFICPTGDLREYKLRREDTTKRMGFIRLKIRNATRSDQHRMSLKKGVSVPRMMPSTTSAATSMLESSSSKSMSNIKNNGSISNSTTTTNPAMMASTIATTSSAAGAAATTATTTTVAAATTTAKPLLKSAIKAPPVTSRNSLTKKKIKSQSVRITSPKKVIEKIKIDTFSPTRGVVQDFETEIYDAYKRVQIRGNDVKQVSTLFKIARQREPSFEVLEISNLKVANTKFDTQFVEEFSKQKQLRKLRLDEFQLLTDFDVCPPFLECLVELPELEELEIYLEHPDQLPWEFLNKVCKKVHTLTLSKVMLLESHIQLLCSESAALTNLILWNANLDFKKLKVMCEYLHTNHTMRRFEIWCSDLGDNFGLILAEMLEKNVSLETLVVSHAGLYGTSCISMMEALKSNDTLRDLILLSVAGTDKDYVSKSAMQLMAINLGIESLSVTYEEMNQEDCLQVHDELKKKFALKKQLEEDELFLANEKKRCIIL